jgi:hypothetical protein
MVLEKRCGAEAAESDCGHFIRSRRKKKKHLGERNGLKSTVEIRMEGSSRKLITQAIFSSRDVSDPKIIDRDHSTASPLPILGLAR